MKTPYDTAMRIQQSEVDDVRVAINIQVNQLVQVESARSAVDAALVRESAVAVDEALLPSFAYVARMRAERARLTQDQAVIDARLGQLRTRAVAAYSSLKAIESAADGFRAEAERQSSNAEQTGIDDLAASALVRNRAAARRATPR